MVRETRHLWVGNLPENIREERIREHFKRYGRVQSVKLLPRCTEEKTGEVTMACTVAFMDIKSASKAHNAELKIDDRTLNTEYYEPAAIPSATASPQNTPSPYSTSPGPTRFPNGHGSNDDHATSFPDRCFYERSSSSSRLVGGSSGGGTGPSGAGTTDTPEFAGGGRGGSSRGISASTTVPASSTYHGDAVPTPASRTSSSSSSSTAPVGIAASGGRNRDRTGSYRNGPYGTPSATSTSVNAASSLEGRHAPRTPSNNTWGYETPRYNSTGNNQTDTGYTATLADNNERRNSDQSLKKKTKSRSGSRSPSPSGSASSRSLSRSRSRSSSSSSSSSMSRDTSSTGSPKSKRLTSSSNSNSNHQPVVHSDDRRPLAICVKNLPVRSSDTSLKDGLFHEYKKHGKVTWVKVVGKDAERHAIVCFKKPEDVEKALEVSYDKLFFGCKIEVEPYQGYDVEDNDLRPYEAEIDEYHPKATRTLFIGNLEKDVTASDLRKHFDQFGEIIEIDIKKQGAVSSYAFCQYSDIVSVVKAIRKMDGEHLGNNRIKLGFGKSMPYNCVWIDGINENVNEKYLKMQFEPFGVINKLHIDREKGQALIFYDQVMSAQTAVTKMRGFTLKSTKIQVDFASRECQESFFERLEKQNTIILDRSAFEESRGPTTRTFESATPRFSRYDTPTRPRTSSYSSRSTAVAGQVTSLQSPGTPGSVTPRGGSSRSRARFPDYYDQTLDYAGHFRSYDEYSQSSTASHEDLYEHEYGYVHEAGDPLQVIDNVVPYAPPDMRNLQKERVHLLEQLEECPSSGDELISPKKRLKLDLLDTVITSDVIIEANRDHRKVMEVRRLSDVNLKHHSRRPSIDSGKHVRHDVVYVPHSVCKRRKTAGSDSGSKLHHYDLSGPESVGGSRPGTPLCDERPENFQPSEPRRVPREREGPLTLPLPRFASQIMNRGPVSVAGIKGQKDNILSSPPPAVTSPRISNPRPPSPVHVPPPASPPPRPPSLSSNSSDSDANPPSPSLEERIKSLDEKYEKWSGSRALSAAGGDALALLDANLEKFRQRHKILDLDLKEVQPSEIVKSVMAKRSVFDEDLKRLENVGEKYEPKDFTFFPRSTLTTPIPVPVTPVQPTPVLKINTVTQLPKTPTLLSPRSTGSGIQAAKGLQYPFPTHPPNLMSPVVSSHPQTPPATTASTSQLPPSVTTAIASSVITTTTSSITTPRGASHGDNRLKPSSGVPTVTSDTRTSSKMIVNKTSVVSSLTSVKTSEKINIPREVKPGDKADKISSRRDSSSSGNSPRADVKTRRNSDTSSRRSDDSDVEQVHKERAQSEERKKERMEKIKVENEKLEKEKSERERIERERHEHEKQEKIRLEKERLDKERQERESELEKQRLEKERLEKERLEKEQQEKERQEREKREKENLEKAVREKERLEKEKQEQERLERERIDKEKKEKEESEQRLREEQHEKERLEKERHDNEKREREEHEKKLREEKERRDEEDKHEKPDKHSERERAKHKEDNHHDRRKDEHKHHSDKYRENHVDKHLLDSKNTKDEKLGSRDVNQISTKDSHESRSSYDKNKLIIDRDSERRKESIKENRDNNIHEKHKSISENRIRELVETRHMSIETKANEKHDPSKRKERNNSLPASIGSKRRFSSHETLEMCEESKKAKLSYDHKKLSERRDSKDSTRSEDRIKSSKHKNNVNKSYDKYNSLKDSEEKRKEREERHKKHKLEKQKSKSKSREKETHESVSLTDKEFLNKLELKATEDVDKHRKEKESKEKRDEHDKVRKEKLHSDKSQPTAEKICKSRSDPEASSRTSEEKKKRDRPRKLTNSSDSDSDEPKKHSIFDIVDDEPAYISMYDKVKARSCKNMAKLEEEKRQEKLKAKFTQLKQSRAKREEKKRSTSWDEDSDSDKDICEIKVKRCPKMLIDSSDDESQDKSLKKKDVYSDSDCSAIYKQLKQELMDTSEDESKNKNLILKALKPRLTGESEDERNKQKMESIIKSEFSPDSSAEISVFNTEDKSHLFKIKDEVVKIKTERRNSKHQESEISSPIFSDVSQPEVKIEKLNNKHAFIDITTDDEAIEAAKKERSERREKKHKKKQKKQKHSVSSEESCKFENISDSTPSENQEKSKHEKKREHGKKEKRRDKNREGREKSKKSKKNKLENKVDSKREGKMENIFGSLSEDSENGVKELEQEPKVPNFVEEVTQHQNQVYNSESEKEHDNKTKEKSEREREKEEHKRKKEKRRREKERRIQEAAAAAAAAASLITCSTTEQGSNDNSMDYIDMGKQLEANMMQDEGFSVADSLSKTTAESNLESADGSFHFTEQIEHKKDKEEKREGKEKKKKRKKSKDEKSRHHNHHHDKNKIKTSEVKKDSSRLEPVIEPVPTTPIQPQNPSLPNILEEQSPVNDKNITTDIPTSPQSPGRPKTPCSPEIKREKLIPGFGTEVDEKIHESAVKSIAEFENSIKQEEVVVKEDEERKPSPLPDEKPRVVISQEETEDAVAALLGESFGSGKQEEFYNDDTSIGEPPNSLVEETNVQDDEEMRQAVQSLSATDLDVKPDTPQSEHDLQIDTDTEEQEDVPLRFDSTPKTPEPAVLPQVPKKLDVPPYYNNVEDKPTQVALIKTTNIGSPPSLTPIRSSASLTEATKVLDVDKREPCLKPDTQPWSADKKLDVPVTKSQMSVIKIETKKVPPMSEALLQHCSTISPSRLPYTSPPVLKIAEPQYPPLKPLSKPDHLTLSPGSDIAGKVPFVQSSTKSPTPPQLHNLPARSPIQMNKPPSDSGLLSPRLTPIHNRMPITSVMVSKPIQATTVILQQSKIAHSLEPPKLVPASEPRPQERPRMVFQNSTIQPPQFGSFGTNNKIIMPGNIRHLPPQGLLVSSRNPFNYMGNISHTAFNVSTSHENPADNLCDSRPKLSQPLPLTIPPPLSAAHSPLPHLSIPKEGMNTKPLSTPAMSSPKAMAHSPSPFSPVCVSPQLKNSPSPINVPPEISPNPVAATMSPKPAPSVSPKPSASTPTSEACPILVLHSAPKVIETPAVSSPKSPVVIQAVSAPSPVIIAAPSNEPIKTESKEKDDEKPIKLAIEAVTEELNLSLEKSSPEIKEEKLPELEAKSEIPSEVELKPELQENIKQETVEEKPVVDNHKEIVADIKEIEKTDEEKTETESVLSDASKERCASADILAKDDPLDTKEDSDYWSAKEAIDSVIKTLVSPDELSNHSSENGKNEWFDDPKPETKIPEKSPSSIKDDKSEKKEDAPAEPKNSESELANLGEPETNEVTKDPPTLRSSSRRGGRGRGRGKQTLQRGTPAVERGGIQTRRGKLKELSLPPTPPVGKRGRGGKARTERKSSKSESESAPADVYEFRDEPDEANKEQRPRLILTIKSPAISSSNNNAQTTAIVKEVTKDGAKEIGKEQPKDSSPTTIVKTPEIKEEFVSPSTNTRKSRRLQERDTSKNTVDDTIEDVVKNTIQTRASANQRRSGRQANPKQSPPQMDTPRKSPRGRKGRRASEATETSSSEETSKEDIKVAPIQISPQVKTPEKPKEPENSLVDVEKPIEKPVEKVAEPVKEKPFEGLKATVLRRIKGEMNQNPLEPTNLIDPVTGELIPMRESEEGKYIPLPGTVSETPSKKPEDLAHKEAKVPSTPQLEKAKPLEAAETQPTVIAQPQPVTVVQQPKPQSLKAHVLSSQAAQAIVNQQAHSVPTQTKITVPSVVVSSKPTPQEIVVSKPSSPLAVSKPVSTVVITKSITPIVASKTIPVVVSKTTTPVVVSKPVTPISQHLTINTNVGMSIPSSPHISPRANVAISVANNPHPKQLVKAPVLSPILMTQQKQQIQQIIQAGKQPVPKVHITSAMVSQAQMVNTQMAHMKPQTIMKQTVMMTSKGPMKSLHPQQVMSGAVPSQPVGKSHSTLNNPGRIIQALTPAGVKGIMDPPKVEVTMSNVLLGQRPKLSPQGPQQRIVGQTGLPLPGYEPNLHGERSFLNRSRSPPPAHQNSPSPKGEAIAHFPPGTIRPSDLNPSHYMHPSHMMQYQQYLRQQQLQHYSRSGGMEKVGDGQEGEEAPVTSPPLELRRPGSVGLALTGRGSAVPHSLHSPHDRTTDSPQIGQVFNVHPPARIPSYHHPSRYYDQAEPPPAHRPLISHGSLAALGSDRGLAHMAPIGTPDRPLSGHSAVSAHMGSLGPADRPISTHIERPLSAHALMGAGLGAAGNLMGAVARHIGAEAPTSQRGLQAATPPHASQVPPQAESLLMLLKQYPCMWQGLLALKNDQAAVQMYFVSGNDDVAKCSLPKNTDGSTPPLRIFQRMRLEPPQVEGVARKMQMENEHCMLLALPCGRDHMDVLKQSTNLTHGFITYLQQKQAAGIVNVAAPGTTTPPAYVVHIFPSCDFVNENLRRIAPSLLERVADIAHLLIVITTV